MITNLKSTYTADHTFLGYLVRLEWYENKKIMTGKGRNMEFKPLPIGVDDFEKLRENDYYYIDKTLLIKELLDKKGEVNLFTRPRRFGKTLNISMLKCFFEISDSNRETLFSGLNIMNAGERYLSYMGMYPVIAISLKSTRQDDFETAYAKIIYAVSEEFRRHKYLLHGDKLDSEQKDRYLKIMNRRETSSEYTAALKFLSEVLMQYHGKKAIILIDEYDVPLEHAYFTGYYSQMSSFIRSFFEEGLKSNPFLEFAVITGCLRITKESIFTGLNNLKINSILSANYDEHFGFLQAEVNQMAEFYGIADKESLTILKEWYDGYLFGTKEVYNPWSVINHMEAMYVDRAHAWPSAHWANTSSNRIVRNLIEQADLSTKEEIERLIGGGFVEKPVHEDITYDDIEKSEDNLWNFLFFTGYLTMSDRRIMGGTPYVTMIIPNDEVRYIYKTKILDWFHERLQEKNLSGFYNSLANGDTGEVQTELTSLLRESISFYDNKEAFYHGFLLGLLERIDGYVVSSNQEFGDGRYDIMLKSPDVSQPVMIFELKIADSYREMETAAQSAIAQIETRHYGEGLNRDGYSALLCYGVAFYKKNCFVLKAIQQL